jgi:ABC-type Mn2+/Zn2+ transport system ATPase subunit
MQSHMLCAPCNLPRVAHIAALITLPVAAAACFVHGCCQTLPQGVPRRDVRKEVDEAIKAVGLTEKRNERSAALSGGQKRKLSVAIAFIGGSSTVFLDEPTSGERYQLSVALIVGWR